MHHQAPKTKKQLTYKTWNGQKMQNMITPYSRSFRWANKKAHALKLTPTNCSLRSTKPISTPTNDHFLILSTHCLHSSNKYSFTINVQVITHSHPVRLDLAAILAAIYNPLIANRCSIWSARNGPSLFALRSYQRLGWISFFLVLWLWKRVVRRYTARRVHGSWNPEWSR